MSLITTLLRSDTDVNPQAAPPLLAVGQVVIMVDATDPKNPQLVDFPIPPYINPLLRGALSRVNYTFGICVAVAGVNPVIVSEDGMMRWTTLTVEQLTVIGVASAAALAVAQTRTAA